MQQSVERGRSTFKSIAELLLESNVVVSENNLSTTDGVMKTYDLK